MAARENQKSFEECKRVLERVKRSELEAVTAGLVLAEVAWTLGSHYKWEKNRVALVLKSIVNLGGLRFVNGYGAAGAVERFSEKTVKFVDAMIGSIREVADGEWIVVSYDRDFDKLGVKRVEPGAI